MRCLALLLALAALARSAEPVPLLQLGSDRFRHPGFSEYRENRLLFSADGQHLVTFAPHTQTIRTWNPTTGQLVREIALATDYFQDIAWSPDGKWLATLETIQATAERPDAQFLRLRDATTGKVVRSVPHPDQDKSLSSHTLAFLPGGKEVAATTLKGVAIWEVATGTELIHQRLPTGPYSVLGVSPDGKRIVRPDPYSNKFLLWDWASPDDVRLVYHHSTERFAKAIFSPDGKTLALPSYLSGPIALLDVTTGKLLREFRLPERRRYESLAFTPDGTRLLAADNGGTNLFGPQQQGGIVVWDVATGRVLDRWKAPGAIGALALSPDGKRVALNAPGLPVFEVATGKRLNPDSPTDRAHASSVIVRAGLILTLSETLPAYLWDERGKLLHTFPHEHHYIRGGAISPDGKRVATGSYDAIQIWDTASGKLVWKLPAHGIVGHLPVFTFTADSNHLVSCGSDHYLRVTELTHGKAVREFALRPQGRAWDENEVQPRLRELQRLTSRLTLSPDGAFLALGGSIFDTRTGAEVQTIAGPPGFAAGPYFSTEGRLLFQCEQADQVSEKIQGGFRQRPLGKETLRCYDVATGEVLWAVELDHRYSHRLALAPDGRTLAYTGGSGNERGDIEFRSVTDGRLLGKLSHPSAESRHLAYLPDGKRLAVTLTDGTVRVYAVPGFGP
jgi:WD40 repeat protein